MTPSMNRTRLKDIADATGFSANTVSRALKDMDDISEKTRQIIKKRAAEMGYIADAVAGSLRSGSTRTIAVILGDVSNPHFGLWVREIEAEMFRHDYSTLIINTDEDETVERAAIVAAIGKRVDGIILCPTQKCTDCLDLLDQSGIPYVLLGRRWNSGQFDYVVLDDAKGGCLAVRNLFERGARRVLFLNGPEHISSSRERLQGYLAAHQDKGLPFDPSLVHTVGIKSGECGKVLRNVIEQGVGFDGVLAFSDIVAFEVLDEFRKLGGKYGRIPIVGFDDVMQGLALPLPLDSVDSAEGSPSVAAAGILLHRMEERYLREPGPRQQIVLNVRIVHRNFLESYQPKTYGMKQYLDNNGKNAVKDLVFSPLHGVRLTHGLLRTAFDNNIRYLGRIDTDAMLYWFRMRADKNAPGKPYTGHFEDNIKGQTAGLYLMGAGNTLRWEENETLRQTMNRVVAEIARCAEPDGYLMAVPKQEFGTREYPHYVRIWLTYGLVAAALAGNLEAFPLLRRWQDWFNSCDDLPIIRYLVLAFQGVVASTYLYNTPIGRSEDIDVTIRYYEEEWRLAQFINRHRDKDVVHIRRQPGYEPHPHGTEIEAMEGYLDLHRATGKMYYLNAVKSFYELYKRDWQHPGGGIVMCEAWNEDETCHPKCYWLTPDRHYNELCCSSFWLLLNQRFHRLDPEAERYVAEMEASLYNVAIANQDGDETIEYFAHLDGRKVQHESLVHCCCGVGTRLFGSLPEYVFSFNSDSLYVDLFAAAQFDWEREAGVVRVTMETEFPYGIDVALRFDCDPQDFSLKVRIPRWVEGEVACLLNGRLWAKGTAGSYLSMSRRWATGDRVTFSLAFAWKSTLYEGAEQVKGHVRYAYESGPLLMSFTGPLDDDGHLVLSGDPLDLPARLRPAASPMHFTLVDDPGVEVLPYLEIPPNRPFTCFPLFKS